MIQPIKWLSALILIDWQNYKMDTNFRVGHSSDPSWQNAVKDCLEQIGPTSSLNLGFLYVVEPLGQVLDSILELLRAETGITTWTGASAAGVLANETEYFGHAAVAIMLARLPQNAFEVFEDALPSDKHFAIVHCDSRRPDIESHIAEIGNAQNNFLVGGVTMPEGRRISNRPVNDWRTTGIAFGDSLQIQTGVTQGCSPIGPTHIITKCRGNLIFSIDDEPALQILKNEMGPILSKRLENASGYIFAATPIDGSDMGDYLVRNIMAVDINQNALAIAADLKSGDKILFCKRDEMSARTDLRNMVRKVARRHTRPLKAALYYSCIARGPNLFGPESQEILTIQSALNEGEGGVPLVGFFANGEISNDRLYTYTGVLTTFS